MPDPDAPTLLTLHHVGIPIPAGAEPQALAFYSQIPGLTPIPKPAELAKDGGLWFQLPDGRHLHLQIDVPLPAESRTHPSFLVQNLDALAQLFEQQNIPVQREADWPGVRRFKIRDPFGNTLEFLDATSDPLQLP